jgi:gliding motility-associated-like protein
MMDIGKPMKPKLPALFILLLLLFSAFHVNNVKGQIVTQINDTICSGDVSHGYTATGVYSDTFSVAGGDSVRILDLTVIPRIGSAPYPRWFNTGTDDAGGRLPSGALDLRWKVSTDKNGPYYPAVVMNYIPPNYSLSIWPDCIWVSHNLQGSHSGNMFYYYRIDFDLPCFDSCGNSFNSDSIFCLMLDLLVDNSVYEVFVNDVPQSANMGGVIPVSNPYSHVGFQNANRITLTLCKGWKRGRNTLIIQTASGCCNAGLLVQASVNAPPPAPVVRASFDIEPVAGMGNAPDTGCAPYSVEFRNTSIAFTDLEWNFGDGSPVSTVDNPTHTYNAPGNYTVRLIATSSLCGNRSDTTFRTVTVYDYPAVDLGPDLSVCEERVTLRPSVPQSGLTWLWDDGSTASSRSVSQSGTYWLEGNRHGCITRDTIEVNLLPGVTVDLGPDTGICDRDIPLILYARQAANASLLWSNGLSDTMMSVTRTGTYWLHVSLDGCESSDTINVTVVPTPEVDLGADSIICEQTPHNIGAVIPGATYTWNTGAATSHISVNETNDYILTVNLQGCRVSDTIQITAMPTPDIDLGPDQDICPDGTVTIDATYGTNSTYIWSSGATTPSYTATMPGTYWVEVTSEYTCVGSDTILLQLYPKPTVTLGADTTVCEETPLVLAPQVYNAESLLWSDGSGGNTLTITSGGEYIVTGINKCGTGSDTITVNHIFCEIRVPNAFSPDGDGSNDVFKVLGNIGRMDDFHLSIFNRWGQRIFETRNKFEGWDGIHEGRPAPLGVYVYLLEYSIGGKPYVQKGNFHLIR